MVTGLTKAWLGNVGELAKAGHTHSNYSLTSHSHSAGDITSGTLPVTCGGTGVTSLDDLKSVLGVKEQSQSILSEWELYVDETPGSTSVTINSTTPQFALTGTIQLNIQGTNGYANRLKLERGWSGSSERGWIKLVLNIDGNTFNVTSDHITDMNSAKVILAFETVQFNTVIGTLYIYEAISRGYNGETSGSYSYYNYGGSIHFDVYG